MKGQIMKLIVLLILLFSIPVKVNAQLPEWEGYKRTYTPKSEDTPEGTKTYYYNTYWTGTGWYGFDKRDKIPELVQVSYDVTYNYSEAYKMIDLVNEERKGAGLGELKTNDYLMQLAMERAAETALYWSHRRPESAGFETKHMFIESENICAGAATAEDAFNAWKNSSGHYANMMDKKWTYAGYGCVEGGYWVQIFSYEQLFYEVDCFGDETKRIYINQYPLTQISNYSETFTTYLDTGLISLILNISNSEGHAYTSEHWFEVSDCLEVGETYSMEVILGGDDIRNIAINDAYKIENMTPEVCSVTGKVIQIISTGTAKIRISLGSNERIFEIPVIEKEEDITLTVEEDDGTEYEIIDKEKYAVYKKAGDGKSGSVIIPDTIRYKNVVYKVTKIADKALYKNKNVTEIYVGKNITEIGKNTFCGCKKLRRITIKSSKLKKVGKNAIKGIYKRCTIWTPKKKLKTYKKLFHKKSGYKKTMIIWT